MPPRLRPVIIGAGAGLVLLVLPGALAPVVVIAAALLAGWQLPDEPMNAALLFLAPTILLAVIRLLIASDGRSMAGVALGLAGAVLFAAIFTHVGAGIALRRARSGP